MFARIRKLGRFIKRLFKWIPILWDQEDWDFAYFYPLLKAKMEDIRANIATDTWHESKGVKRNLKEIDICLARMDRYLNWTDYYDYPLEDIYMVPVKGGGYQMKYYSEENEKQRQGALPFEERNYKKFWEDFVKWHRGWWT